MKMKGKHLCILGFLVVALLLVQENAVMASPQYLIKFATVAPDGSTWMNHMRALDAALRKESNGRLGFAFYAGGIAGDELDMLRRIRIGQIHCAAFSGVGLGQVLPMVRVLDLPFLFRNDEEVDRIHEDLRPYFAEAFRKQGFEFLAWAEVGHVHVFSKKPIHTIHDFAGLKVWTWSGDPIARETFSAMGVHPIPLPITDVITSLNTGMIDTVYAPPLGALALQWQMYLRDMMALPLTHSTGALLLSSAYFKKMPEDLSRMLLEGVDRAMVLLTSELRERNQEAIAVIQQAGITIGPVPEGKALDEFYAIGHLVAQRLRGQVYPEDLLERVYTLLNRPAAP